MKLEICKCFEMYCEAQDLTLDWLIKSWELKDEDKKIAQLYYKKSCKERKKLIKCLFELIKK